MQVFPNVYQIKTPLPDNPLGYVSAYLVISGREHLLIDTGWDTGAAFEVLRAGLEQAGSGLEQLTTLLITHNHPDHAGMAARIKSLTGVPVVMHAAEARLLEHHGAELAGLLERMDAWLALNGLPAERPVVQMPEDSFVTPLQVDRVVHGGERLRVGEFDLELIWTPGHSPGHLCLLDRGKRLFFSGDHVLPRTTPNVSMYVENDHNPLRDYLESLELVAGLEADLALPSHGKPFHELQARAHAIRLHHEERLALILAAFTGGRMTAWQAAAALPWTRRLLGWEALDELQQRFALTETIAHLELLAWRGELHKTREAGLAWFSRA